MIKSLLNKHASHEILKSILYGLLALVFLFFWLKFQSSYSVSNPRERIGEKLFAHLDDLSQMSQLSIVRFNKALAASEQIHLEKKGETWQIAEYSSYPAENAEQMARVVAPLPQLTILNVSDELSQNASEEKIRAFHADCGVLDPSNTQETDVDSQGVHLKILSAQGQTLVNLLVGHQVAESSAVRDIRYVRLPGDDLVYTVDFLGESAGNTDSFCPYPDTLSVAPLDWINRDLLQISRWNILELSVFDYPRPFGQTDSATISATETSVPSENFLVENSPTESDLPSETLPETESPTETEAQSNMERLLACLGDLMIFEQDPTNSIHQVWTLAAHQTFSSEKRYQPLDGTLFAKETANNKNLNETADLLGHLKIAAVERKSANFANICRANHSLRELIQQNESLETYGFVLAAYDPSAPEDPEPQPQIFGQAGQIRLLMKDGTLWNLSFGKQKGSLRYFLPMVVFNPHFPKAPELLPLLDVPEDASESEKSELQRQNAQIQSENSLRKSEHALNLAEGQANVATFNARFADWIYLIDETDFQKLLLHPALLLETKP